MSEGRWTSRRGQRERGGRTGFLNAEAPDPVALLREDRARAVERGDPMANLCVLADDGRPGEPEARTMVLRDLEVLRTGRASGQSDGVPGRLGLGRKAPPSRAADFVALEPALSGPPSFGLFVNSTSPKFREFHQSSTIVVVVYLPSLSVQYRLRCTLDQLPEGLVRASWQLRPSIPKRMDWLYEDHPQSSAITGRRELLDLLAGSDPDAAPESAVGFRLVAETVERLDLATPDGVHDRRRYNFDGQSWREEILVP